MAALKKPEILAESDANTVASATSIRVVSEDHALEPVVSPTHELQQALRSAGYHSEGFRERPMSNAMFILTLVCVYALAMMMMMGSFSV